MIRVTVTDHTDEVVKAWRAGLEAGWRDVCRDAADSIGAQTPRDDAAPHLADNVDYDVTGLEGAVGWGSGEFYYWVFPNYGTTYQAAQLFVENGVASTRGRVASLVKAKMPR